MTAKQKKIERIRALMEQSAAEAPELLPEETSYYQQYPEDTSYFQDYVGSNDEYSEEEPFHGQERSPAPRRPSTLNPYISIAAVALCAIVMWFLCSVVFGSSGSYSIPADAQDADEEIMNQPQDMSQFVVDTDFSVENMSDGILGIVVPVRECALLSAPDGSEVGGISIDDTLFVYGIEGEYLLVEVSGSELKGYVSRDDVDTGGVELSQPAPIVGGETAEEPQEQENTEEKETKTTGKTKKTGSKTEASEAPTTSLSPEDFPTNSSPYFILVEKGSHTITIYAKDENGKYTREVRTYLTATGRTTSLTPIGLFSIGAKEKWHQWGATSYSPYCSCYKGGLFFHGPLYSSNNFGSLKENSVAQIGTNASSGCMRTSAQAAYFIYRFCPSGTYVKIVSGSPLGHGSSKPSISSQYTDPATGEVPVAGVSLSPAEITLKVGESKQLSASVAPDLASEKACTWLSGNTSIATVSSGGMITAKKPGTAVITVTTVDGNFKATCMVNVIDPNATTTTTTETEPSETQPSEAETTEASSSAAGTVAPTETEPTETQPAETEPTAAETSAAEIEPTETVPPETQTSAVESPTTPASEAPPAEP